MNCSAASLASLPPDKRAEIVQNLSPTEAAQLLFAWRFWARPAQIAPDGDWRTWLQLAGRGFGKTRSGAEWIRERVDAGAKHLILAGATAGDVRDIMVEGESGLLAISPPGNRPRYESSKARLTWPSSGARALLLSADEPERFRGKQCDTFWADELAAWRYPDAWDQLQLGFRLGANYGIEPRGVVTTTPRPTPIIKALLANPTTVRTGGSTYENRANLAPAFLEAVVKRYERTRLGRQELHAEILDDAPGALWKRPQIDALRVDEAPELKRIVVAIDPSVSAEEGSNETGIVTTGLGVDGHGYVLSDLSGVMTPAEWGAAAVRECKGQGANRIVAESNQGGLLVEANIKAAAEALDARGIVVTLVHASRGKQARAEPVASLYEQGRVHHVGVLAKLEDQLCEWVPGTGGSPDRLDALVWGLTDLMIDSDPRAGMIRPRAFPTAFEQGQRLGTRFQW